MNPIKNWKTTLAGGLFAALIAIQQFTSAGGDVSDWKQWVIPALIALLGVLMPDPRKGGQPPYLPLLLLTCLLCQCASKDSTDAEIQRAQSALQAATVAYDLAVLIYEPRLTTGTWSPAEKLVAQRIMETSRKRLADEQAKLADILARRAAAAVAAQPVGDGGPPATPLLPAITGTK